MHRPRLLCLRSTQYVAISPPRLLNISIVRRKRHVDTDAFFRNGTCNGGALHFTLGIYDDTSIVL